MVCDVSFFVQITVRINETLSVINNNNCAAFHRNRLPQLVFRVSMSGAEHFLRMNALPEQ